MAQANGFEVFPTPVKGSLANYENIDNHQSGIHDYFKYLKYAFGRTTDIACNYIRRGRMSRADALEVVKERDGAYPHNYMGKSLGDILSEIDMTMDEFDDVCDRFSNKSLFCADADGKLIKDKSGRPVKINYDNNVG